MNHIWSQEWDIGAQVQKNQEIFFWTSIFATKTKASKTETLLVQKVAYAHDVRLDGFCIFFFSFEKYKLRMKNEFSTFFHHFLAQKTRYEYILMSILHSNLAYETLVQFMKPWTLYLVSVLR